jgi:uncharacterized protein
MRFGLPHEMLEQIRACFAQYPDIKWVKIYGSRALGTYQPGSDIDLAFSSGKDYSLKLESALEELPTPYMFDVTHYESIQNQSLQSHIDRVGQILWTMRDLHAAP